MPRALRIEPKHRIVAQALSQGTTIEQALLLAGYSAKTARQGRRRIPKAVLEAVLEQHNDPQRLLYERLTNDAEALEAQLLGSIYHGMVTGQGAGVALARALAGRSIARAVSVRTRMHPISMRPS